MYLSYKLSSGKKVSVFDYGILEEERNGSEKYWREYSDAYMTAGDYRCDEGFKVKILKDQDRGFYFICEGERVYVSDYEALTIDELKEKLANKEYVSFDLLMASLMKNADSVAFIEKRRIPDSIWPEFSIRSYCGPARYEKVLCIPTERRYSKEKWQFEIETKPLYEVELNIFGHEKYYGLDYYDRLVKNEVKLISRNELLGNDCVDKCTRSRKKEN